MNRVFPAVLLALVATTAAATEFYKWKDANGVWQYTTTPPPTGAASSTLSVRGDVKTDSPAIEPNDPNSPAATASAEKANSAQPATAEMTEEIRKKRAELCENAKQRVAVLRDNAVVQMEGKQLSPEEQSTELSKAQQGVTVYCAPG